MKNIELLAPAKNLDYGKLAINCGADALYIGSPKFSARSAAHNGLPEIKQLITYAHQYRVKVYIALNTILYDNEIDEATSLINHLYEDGADGIIIQDMGLLECGLPPIKLIASTQCDNYNTEKVLFMEKVGFSRVILARELSLEQIGAIRNMTTVELEFFVHGALCVSRSGRCYMSYASGKRSANRGECAQPCRKKYSVVDSSGRVIIKSGNLLSPKDFNLSDHIESLINAGISSFKIEGRLKDDNYLKNTVLYYRKMIDRVLDNVGRKKSSSGRIISEFIPDISKTFNRGFTDYNISGIKKKNNSGMGANNTGEKIGTVIKKEKKYFVLDNEDLSENDGITFFKNGEITGTKVISINEGKIYPLDAGGIINGMTIYRNYSDLFISSLKKANVRRVVDITYKLYQRKGSTVFLLFDDEGHKIKHKVSGYFTADNPEMMKTILKKNLSKIGGTIYNCNDIDVDIEKYPFMPIKEINAVRNILIEKLNNIRNADYKFERKEFTETNHEYPTDEIYFHENVLNKKSEEFYIRHKCRIVEKAAESGLNMTGKILMKVSCCVLFENNLCGKISGDCYLLDGYGNKYKLVFNCGSCEMLIVK